MIARQLQGQVVVWLLLVVLTLISVEFIGMVMPARAMIAIMALAAAKASLVAWSYMGMSAAPIAWRAAFGLMFWLGAAMIATLNVLS